MCETKEQPGNVFTWRAHPACERRGRLLVGFVWIIAFVLVVYATTGSAIWAAFSLLMLVFALNRFFFPSRFTIDEEGITAEYPMQTRRRSWQQIRRFAHNRDGGYLSAHATPSRLDAWRGMHILFGEKRDEVVKQIRRHLPTRKEVH